MPTVKLKLALTDANFRQLRSAFSSSAPTAASSVRQAKRFRVYDPDSSIKEDIGDTYVEHLDLELFRPLESYPFRLDLLVSFGH